LPASGIAFHLRPNGMKPRKWGRIINVLNILAKAPRGGGRTAVSRAAGMALTKVLANEYAPHTGHGAPSSRLPVDLQAVTRDVKARVRRVIGELEAIERQQDPIFASPRDVFFELVLSNHAL
jgi:NAD(P)-dependent dehydrogenase (short-subunit alcohol dehydrogenase family)